MATILAHISIEPGREAAFEETCRRLHRATHRDERRVRRYEYWRGQEPGRYYCLLSFDDFAGFIAHQTSEHHEHEAPAIRDSVSAIRLEWLDPVQGASDLVPTEHQSARSDADDLTARYTDLFAAEIAAWWHDLR